MITTTQYFIEGKNLKAASRESSKQQSSSRVRMHRFMVVGVLSVHNKKQGWYCGKDSPRSIILKILLCRTTVHLLDYIYIV